MLIIPVFSFRRITVLFGKILLAQFWLKVRLNNDFFIGDEKFYTFSENVLAFLWESHERMQKNWRYKYFQKLFKKRSVFLETPKSLRNYCRYYVFI